ncbi:hypothetical protein DY000_02038060 [Brassica cretica]|uniref:Bet v I/Major latex protein domain-containing protein n=1 Tax=Brassica cretica TaxID=69181 RepID=A0ABQ7BJE0_BRACR|nr:hypothetical protein DY000_02038060 [Brassica cretica]
MATSGTYVTEVPLKGTAEKHYKRWKSENHVFPDAIGHHIQNVTVHEGEHDSHGSIRSWNYTWGIHLLYFFSFFSSQHISFIYDYRNLFNELIHVCEDGKEEMFKEKREVDDENLTLTLRGLEGHVMEQLKVYDVIYQFIPKTEDTCACKITIVWEKRNDDSPEPSTYMKFVKSLVADMDHHVNKA